MHWTYMTDMTENMEEEVLSDNEDTDTLLKNLKDNGIRLKKKEVDAILEASKEIAKTSLKDASNNLVGFSLAEALRLLADPQTNEETRLSIILKVLGHSLPDAEFLSDGTNRKEGITIIMPRPKEDQ